MLRSLRTRRADAAAQVDRFEAAFAAAVGTRHAFATASGREALGLIIDGLGLTAGDELIIPAYTLGELLPLLRQRGLELVPADVDPETFNVTAASVAARIGPKSRAILVVHMLGAPCDIEAIARLAANHGLPLIEDCAHAAGARVAGRPVGSFGRAALFSLEPTKAVPAFGGGVLTTDDDLLAGRVAAALEGRVRREWPALRKALVKFTEELLVRSPLYGPLARLLFAESRAGWFDRFYRGANSRVRSAGLAFSGFQARVALRNLQRLDARNRALNARWEALAGALPAGFRPQRRNSFGEPAFYTFVARYDGDIRRLRAAAHRLGVDLGIAGEVMDDTARLLGRDGCPGAADVYGHAVQIPLYAGMSEKRFRQMITTLQRLARELS
jgi:dTDP-4-amino-4,6-dideoxygalactose transaminase